MSAVIRKFAHYARRVRALGPRELAAAAADKISGGPRESWRVFRDAHRRTFGDWPFGAAGLTGRLAGQDAAALFDGADLPGRIEDALAHRFDLLGSGPVVVHHGLEARGFASRRYVSPPLAPDRRGNWLAGQVHPANLERAREIWGQIRGEYQPIDWFVDFRSGYRFDPLRHSLRTPLAPRPGVDIKLPLELGRMQHLLPLAGGYALARAEGMSAEAGRRLGEIRNELLDFLATNPPGFGPNWTFSMDVAIRAANWLMAWDVVTAAGARFDEPFEKAFRDGIYDHGRYILANLEWRRRFRNNHYLANLVGLLFVAAYLPASRTTDAWAALALQELHGAVRDQFHPDGAHGEASTSYHVFSTQMLAYATAIVLGAERPRWEAWAGYDHRAWPRTRPALAPRGQLDLSRPPASLIGREWAGRLRGGIALIAAAVRPDGQMPQFGDNDSGTFARVTRDPTAAETGGDLAAVLGRPVRRLGPQGRLLRALARGRCLDEPVEPPAETGGRLAGLGLCVLRRGRAYLAVRSGDLGKAGAGHAHNDATSFELFLDDQPIVLDCGTFTYLADLSRRNRFRGVEAHNVLQLENRRQNPFPTDYYGAFAMSDRAKAGLDQPSADEVRAWHVGFGPKVSRLLRLRPAGVEGLDCCPSPGVKRVRFHLAPRVRVVGVEGRRVKLDAAGRLLEAWAETGRWSVEPGAVSPRYGVEIATAVLVLTGESTRIAWRIELAGPCMASGDGLAR